MEQSAQNILIVGPGYVGSELARFWREEKGKLVTTVRRSESQDSIACDVSDPDSVKQLAESQSPDLLVHCAASGRGGGTDAYRAVYLQGVENLSRCFPGVPLIFTSSTSVYSQDDGSIVSEPDASATSETAKILRAAEEVVIGAGGTALRLSGIYGPGRSIYLKRLLSGTATIEARDPSRWLNQIHRDDIVSAIHHVSENLGAAFRGEIYNVTDSISLTQRDCLEKVAEILGLRCPPVENPSEASPPKRALTSKQVSNAKFLATGWEPSYPSFLDAVKKDASLVPSIRDLLSDSVA